ncbi:IPExxxVDY family protein [Flavobacterium sufflavum]|uniref:IPExxxVDY family protein n=1 Tax=Flavobacterium sufflavum TaxID=1921138 RepID=A0A437L0F1_9FLAO|nr:IPExxxVDY family protein [Flavobacterium sufflavum]RVT78274.1 IPExxxVDY family protein [Flavobacterium sufflavum]
MAVHKLSLDEFDEIDYNLIAIHTSLEDYRLAYFINQKLPINLAKSIDEVHINIKEGETKFSRFYYYDEENTVAWNLVQNINEVVSEKNEGVHNLFSDTSEDISTKVYLLPEFKKADYFLKIDNTDDNIDVNEIKTILNTIDNITTVYTVETKQIKSKNNLIF